MQHQVGTEAYEAPAPPAVAKIERIRKRTGLDVVTVVELVADQHVLDPEMLAIAHFGWLLERAGIDPP